MIKRLALLATLAILVGVSAQAALAAPTNAPNSLIVTIVCDGDQLQVVVNGNGTFAPGLLLDGSGVFVPTAFDLTFSFTPPGGETQTDTETAAKSHQPANAVTCEIPVELNTFSSDQGTFSISGTVTGFIAPPRG
jgi:hypothetical protein